MLIWIQKHDYSYEELDITSSEDAVEAFVKFDWVEEIKQGNEIEEETCPPGFGLVSESYILHLCPKESGDCLVHLHYPQKEKYLFLFTREIQKTITRESISWEDSILYIEKMFLGNWERMKTMI